MIFIFVYFKICLFPILFISDFVISDFAVLISTLLMWVPQFWMQKIKTLCIKNANIGNYFEITAKMSFFSHYRNINTTQSSLTYLKIIQKRNNICQKVVLSVQKLL